MREREQKRADLQARLASFTGLERLQTWNPQQLRRKATTRLTQWQSLLTRDMAQTRQILRKLLVNRLRFAFDAESATCEFRGQGAFDPILAGILGESLDLKRWCPQSGNSPGYDGVVTLRRGGRRPLSLQALIGL